MVDSLSIMRKISGIGFQPVELKMTGWKPIPRKVATLGCCTVLGCRWNSIDRPIDLFLERDAVAVFYIHK